MQRILKDNENVIRDEPLAILENTARYEDVFLLKSIVDTLIVNSQPLKIKNINSI